MLFRSCVELTENASVYFDFYGIRHKGLCGNLCVLEPILPDWCSGRLGADEHLAGYFRLWHHVDDLCRICYLAVLLRDGCTVSWKQTSHSISGWRAGANVSETEKRLCVVKTIHSFFILTKRIAHANMKPASREANFIYEEYP